MKTSQTVLLSLIFIPLLPRRRGYTVLPLSVCISIQNKCFCYIFLSNYWWKPLDFWRTTSASHPILGLTILHLYNTYPILPDYWLEFFFSNKCRRRTLITGWESTQSVDWSRSSKLSRKRNRCTHCSMKGASPAEESLSSRLDHKVTGDLK